MLYAPPAACTPQPLTLLTSLPPVNVVQVSAVKLVSPPEAQSMLEQISLSVNSIATAWWEVRPKDSHEPRASATSA